MYGRQYRIVQLSATENQKSSHLSPTCQRTYRRPAQTVSSTSRPRPKTKPRRFLGTAASPADGRFPSGRTAGDPSGGSSTHLDRGWLTCRSGALLSLLSHSQVGCSPERNHEPVRSGTPVLQVDNGSRPRGRARSGTQGYLRVRTPPPALLLLAGLPGWPFRGQIWPFFRLLPSNKLLGIWPFFKVWAYLMVGLFFQKFI